MLTAKTMARNLEMVHLSQSRSISEVAKLCEARPSSVRSSVKRTRAHLLRFVTKFPETLEGRDPVRSALKNFAEHVGVEVNLAKVKSDQLDLF